MRRSTAAAVGTLTGAALILGVRLSVTPAAPLAAAPAAQEVADEPAAERTADPAGKPAADPSPSASRKKKREAAEPTAEAEGGLKNGSYQGTAVQNPYGTVQVAIKVSGGRITSANATYPKNGFSGTINPNAVAKLSQQTLKAQSADVDAVSGATYTSQSYAKSLQAALDAAGA
ncbi:FMN-binding protein [Actinoplanes teichomyceticus]|uniref:Uncharacterized protein with FMN-binding domain n=1 Tax=Actinoplanes teichomyceticus TaxID=1867 RepID=A0A561WML6_ACTTI|nr:FMN-binding protein [Actinoplanes teichomyceticus]TWG25112.1 uncharacterized protein with FMN-binding domain [Actinoplanes teichomyceticus]GIF10184.1 hypothetical protein Ate01nite_02160 [Actinoplanes teichomyceticus]